MKKTLTYIGNDSWDRPVYKDDNGKLWKDVDMGRGCTNESFCTCGNDFEGEPDSPMRSHIDIEFVPGRVYVSMRKKEIQKDLIEE